MPQWQQWDSQCDQESQNEAIANHNKAIEGATGTADVGEEAARRN